MASLMILLMATFALHRRVADPPGGAAAWSRDGELITVGLSGGKNNVTMDDEDDDEDDDGCAHGEQQR